MRHFKNSLYLILLFLFSQSIVFSQKIYYAGISNSRLNYTASVQKKPQWCWAASIQMLLNYYKVDISQEQIVERTYGKTYSFDLPDWSANIGTIHLNLNNRSIDNQGNYYVVNAQVGFGAPEPVLLIKELSEQRPVIIAYQANFGGHVVLITALSYYITDHGPIIRSIIVRDPLLDQNNCYNKGRVEYDARTLASRINAYWFVRVFRAIE